MFWQGIEWVVPIYEMAIIVSPIYAFVMLYKRIKNRALDRAKALWHYAAIVILPIIFYIIFFLSLVGIEELINIDLVTEGLARSFFILVGLGIIVWFVSTLIFGITLLFTKN